MAQRVRELIVSLVLGLTMSAPAWNAVADATTPDFDHANTGFELTGQHRFLNCEDCHAEGVFKETPHECTACHNSTLATGKPVTHISTVEQCDVCHSTEGFAVSALVDHAVMGGNCVNCHDGVSAAGKNAAHLPTSNNCTACHSTIAWTPELVVDHKEVTGNCGVCHNGSRATGKPVNHLATTDQCAACHDPAPALWQPLAPGGFDHAQVLGVCSACHNNVRARGQTANHPVTDAQCDTCHSTVSFAFAELDHSAFVNGCVQCHNGVIAVGKPTAHLPSSDECQTCHEKRPARFAPVASANVDHLQVLGACVTCHDGRLASGKSATHMKTSEACAMCHAPGPLPWKPVQVVNVDHGEVIGACSDCHNGVVASGKAAMHARTSDNCQACHQSGPQPWSPVTKPVDHNEVSGDSCKDCHEFSFITASLVAPGKPIDHIPTPDSCDLCHDVNAWLPATFTHEKLSIVNNCALCHTPGIRATAKSATHLPTSEVCEACHTGFVTWGPLGAAQVNHGQVLGTCVSCHDGTRATGKTWRHINSTERCDACHDAAPALWQPVSNNRVDHSQTVGVCIDCHNNATARGWPPTHIDAKQACEACHQPGPALWAPLPPSAVDHTAVFGVCSACHDNVKARGKSATHIPTADQCSVCHSTSTWLTAIVDHGAFTGNCLSCHDGVNASGKSVRHIASSDACQACHDKAPATWTPVAASRVDHRQVVGVCSACHNGSVAQGKAASHIPTNEECDVCHGTTAWLGVSVNHANFVSNCLACHDGVVASGRSAAHIPATNACEACHDKAPARWAPLTPGKVDHGQVLGTCGSCHNGTLATGKASTHIPTVEECDVCHNTTGWLTGVIDHGSFTGNCVSCHNGINASGKSARHLPTSDQCQACHDQAPAAWVPVAPARVDHTQVLGGCIDCHNNAYASGWPPTHLDTTQNCGACHQPGPAAWAPLPAGAVDHTQVRGTCSSCHNNVKARGKSTTHLVTSQECDSCHVTTLWLTATVDHAAFVTNCVSCHDGVNASGKSAAHINSSNQCETCHDKLPAHWIPVAPARVDHGQVLGACASCHDGAVAAGKGASHAPTTNDCAACHAPGPVPWVPLPGRVDHNQVTSTSCGFCHGDLVIAVTAAPGQPADHIPTTASCDLCHNISAWLPATFTHDKLAIVDNCVLCHTAGIRATAKSATHMPTSNVCEACHVNFVSWIPVAPAAVNHRQVIGSCSSCHNSVIATGKSQAHVPTVEACDVCHNTTQWLGAAVDHSSFNGNCLSCHDGVIASGKSAAHIPSSNACDACHRKAPALWTPVQPTNVDHTQVIGTCISCHNAVIASGRSPAHIATTDACDRCHRPAPARWIPVAVVNVDHSQVVGNCVSCHNGTTASGRSPAHITTTDQCNACHGTPPSGWMPVAAANVDHAQVTGTCISCHNGTTASGKSSAHIASTDQCNACHQSAPAHWLPVPVAAVDHAQVIGSCDSCHNNVIARGKGPTHVLTVEACDTCHNTLSWFTVQVDHTNIMTNCISCHNGTNASGKSPQHIAATDTCEACHNKLPQRWMPVFVNRVDHTQVIGTCISCHNNVVASGKGPTHINSSEQCNACHAVGPSPWRPVAPAAVDHGQVLGTCSSCHDNRIATGKPVGHIPTTAQCDTCHITTQWLGAQVDHTAITGNCTSCHNGVNASGKSPAHIATSNLCELCHDKLPAKWIPVAAGRVDHSQVLGNCVSCHNNVVATGKSASHIASSDQCDTCHAPGPAPWGPLPAAAVDHSQVVGACSSCHNNVVATGKSLTHIQTTLECDVCHSVTAWIPVTSVDHSSFTGNCITCHNGTTASGKSGNHITTSDACDSCHDKAPLPWQPVATNRVDHAQVIGTCVSCHNNVKASGKPPTHITTTDVCDACHAQGPVPWKPVATAAVDHAQVVGSCVSCHNNAIAAGKQSTHARTTDLCEACHAPGPAPWAPLPGLTDHTQVLNGFCNDCHGVVAIAALAAAPTQPPDHIPTTESCDLCHNVNAWLPAKLVHSVLTITNNCVQCHTAGIRATARSATHINSTNLCENCHIAGFTAWTPVAPSAVDHGQVVGVCSSCHNNVIATGKSAAHVPTSAECDTCHGTSQWLGAQVDHSSFANNCITCHDGVIASGKSPAHITSSNVCDACHDKLPARWLPVSPNRVDHTQLSGTCFSCHNNVISAGKTASHINTSNVCEACHAPGPAPWAPLAPSAVDHAQVVGVCNSCHNNITARGKPATHLPTTQQCDVCHVTTSWLGATVDHTPFTGSCILCHDGVRASGKSPTHLPTTDNCELCHDKLPAKWLPVVASRVDHTQVIGTCFSCHNSVIASGKSANHIRSSELCDSCHKPGPVPWQPVPASAVDHTQVIGTCSSCHNNVIATGKGPNHVPTSAECDTCHNTSQWLGASIDHTPFAGNCISCHNGTIASGKSPTHINSSAACDSCHDKFPAKWQPVAANRVDHSQVVGSCASCHNGTTASGKSPSHINSSAACDACHASGPAPWRPVARSAVDHTQVVGTCFSCHNGTTASGKSLTHINSSNTCDACHKPGPVPWSPVAAAAVDHSQVVGTCSSCHNNVTASGKPSNHLATTSECDLCHSTSAWTPATIPDHTSFVNNCFSCHNGINASGKSPNHINTSNTCDACHNKFPSKWTPVAANRVDHTQVVGACSSCHSKPAGHINTSNVCDACHAPGPVPWRPVAAAAVDHTQVVGACSTCHSKPAGHMNTSNVCDACHAPGPVPWIPVAAAAVDHTQVVGTCVSCHNNVIATGQPPTHMATTTQCDACHLPGPVPFKPVPANRVDHTQTLGTCSSCHNNVTASGKPAGHVATTSECDLCHSTSAWQPTITPDHTAFSGNCFTCHNGTTASGKSARHINTSNVCDACHNKFPSKWTPVAANRVDHNQVIGACQSCHSKPAGHINTSNLCDSCHAAGPAPWRPVVTVDHTQVIGTCSSCHNGVTARGKPGGHIVTTSECDLCHNTSNWGQVTVVDHSTFSGNCFTCHNGTTASGKSPRHINTTNVCDACHNKFPSRWTPVSASRVDHTQVIGACSNCHTRPGGHINTTNACDACHRVGPAPWAPVVTVDHRQVIGTCSSCHNGSTARGKSASHIPTSDECDVCHNTTTWQGATVDHTNIFTNCVSCHNGVFATGKDGGHLASSDNCEMCHDKAPRRFAPARIVNHNELLSTVCANCHNLPGDHCDTLGDLNCANCHVAPTTSPSSWANNIADCPAAPAPAPAPGPVPGPAPGPAPAPGGGMMGGGMGGGGGGMGGGGGGGMGGGGGGGGM